MLSNITAACGRHGATMKVYVLEAGYQYDGSDVASVHFTKIAADEEGDRIMALPDNKYEWVSVTEHEVKK